MRQRAHSTTLGRLTHRGATPVDQITIPHVYYHRALLCPGKLCIHTLMSEEDEDKDERNNEASILKVIIIIFAPFFPL